MTEDYLVLDASAVVDLLLGEDVGTAVHRRIDGVALHAPAHLDAEVLSGLGRLQRAGRLADSAVSRQLAVLAEAPIVRHGLEELLVGAWERRHRLRLADGLYVELAHRLGTQVLTTDHALGRTATNAEVVTA